MSKQETRIAQIGIIVEKGGQVDELNGLLNKYSEYVVGRMGIPYRERGISIMSIIVDAPNDAISALTGKLGMLKGVSTKALYTDVGKK